MADFIATTVCEPAMITDVNAVKQIIDKYFFGEVDVVIDYKEQLYIYGYEWFNAHKYKKYDDGTEDIDFD